MLVLSAPRMLICNKKAKGVANMDDQMRQTAQKYLELALAIASSEAAERLDGELPTDVQTALLRLYDAAELGERIEKCEALLTDETEQSAVDALTEAARAVDGAAALAMESVAEYARDDRGFERMLDALSAGSEERGLEEKLLKLYKCENIIRRTYEYASAHSYALTPEEYIAERMDVDMDALMALKRALLADISAAMGKRP